MENIGFDFNPYDSYVVNRINFGKQHTLILHVDNFMPSHVSSKVNDKFKKCMNRNYGRHVEVNSNRGKVHKYLGITFDFTEKSQVNIKMGDYV